MVLLKKPKPFNVGLYSDIYGPISFKLNMVIVITRLYILMSVWITLTFTQGHQKLRRPFSCKFKHWFGWNWVFPQPVGLLKLTLYLFCTSSIQGREPCWCDFMKCVINIFMCQDTCELICFKLCMRLYSTKLYNLFTVWITLMFTQGPRVTGKLEVVQLFYCKVAWSSSNVHDSWLCKGDDCEVL